LFSDRLHSHFFYHRTRGRAKALRDLKASLEFIRSSLNSSNGADVPSLSIFFYKKIIENVANFSSIEVGGTHAPTFDLAVKLYNHQFEHGRAALLRRLVTISNLVWEQNGTHKKDDE
jgi:hypothetical protein